MNKRFKEDFDPKHAASYLREPFHCPFCGWKDVEVRPVDEGQEKLLVPFDDLDNCHLSMYSLQTSL